MLWVVIISDVAKCFIPCYDRLYIEFLIFKPLINLIHHVYICHLRFNAGHLPLPTPCMLWTSYPRPMNRSIIVIGRQHLTAAETVILVSSVLGCATAERLSAEPLSGRQHE